MRSLKEEVINSVIPAWRAGIQVDMDVSGSVLADHAAMTNAGVSSSVGERKIMNHFVVKQEASLDSSFLRNDPELRQFAVI
jgi:hypothetical protein